MAPRIAVGLALTACLLTATPAAPAASGALVESCTVMDPQSPLEVTATLDTDLPATMPLGSSATVTTTASVTIPESLSAYAYSLGARSVGGIGQLETDLDGPGLSNVSANITKTAVPPAGSLTVQLVGLPQTFKAMTAGSKVVKGYVYLTALGFADAADQGMFQRIVACSPKVTSPAQDLTIDTVTVAAPAPAPAPAQATTTAVTAAYKKHAKRLKTHVTVTNADRTPASGKVSLVLRRGKVKVSAASVPLNGAGVASKTFKGIGHSGHYVVVAEYGATTTSKASLGKAHFTVP